MELNCKYCKFSTILKNNFNRHLKTKKHIKTINTYEATYSKYTDMNQNEPKMNQNEPKMNQNEPIAVFNEPKMNQNEPVMFKIYQCDYCECQFNTLPSKRRHEIHRCKIAKSEKAKTDEMKLVIEEYKKEANSKINVIIEEYKKDRNELHDHIKMLLLQNHKTTTNNSNNINIGNQTNNTIILNNYGNEDLSYITDEYKSNLLKGPYGMIQKMIEIIHFNKEKPENSNIILPNKKEKLLKIYKNNTWVYKDEVEAIDDLIDAKYFMLDNHFVLVSQLEKSPLKLDLHHEVKYKRFQYLFDRKNDDVHDLLRKDCKMLLLNNK
jgi:hypothetical protein